MNTDLHDEVRRALETALAVEPEPGFQMRVRSRIARTERRTSQPWRPILLCTAGAALVLVTLYVGRTGFWSANHARSAPASLARTTDPTQSVSLTHTGNRSQRTDTTPTANPTRTANRSALRTSRSALRTSSASETVLAGALVPDDQRVALMQLLGALRAGRATVPSTVGATFDADGALAAPAPVVVAPLRIDPLPIPDPEGEPERDQR